MRLTAEQKKQNVNVPWRPGAATVTFQQPEVALNGFLWLATDNPDTADALPSLDNWVAGLRMIPVRSLRPNEMFPAPFTLKFQTLGFNHILKGSVSYPKLQDWSFNYQANDQPHQGRTDKPVFETLANKMKWKDADIWPALPLVRASARSAAAPAAGQAAPVAQRSRSAPSNASGSRRPVCSSQITR